MISRTFHRSGARPALLVALLVLAGALASCSDDETPPMAPVTGDDPPPTSLLTIVGDPHVAVNLTGFMREIFDHAPLTGNFRITLNDSVGRRIFVPGVNLNGVPLTADTLSVQYTLDVATMSGFTLADTLHFAVTDGGDVTPPFEYVIVPSHVFLPDDSTVISQGADLVLKWNGIADRVIITLIDSQGMSLRINLQVENFSGLSKLTIPARDLALLTTGRITVGANLLDTELRLSPDLRRQQVSFQATQERTWFLEPLALP
jgi:hypothetical protein